MKGHFTRDCPQAKKQGCFRCGENHTLRDCPKRLAKTQAVQSVSVESAGIRELQYRVKSGGHEINVLVDTGAQCSLIRKDVARRLQLPIARVRRGDTPNLCGVAGHPLKVEGRVTVICQQAGQTVTVDAWVVSDIQHDVILGMPWLRKQQPTIKWQEGVLVFPSGKEWVPDDDDGYTRWKTINRVQKREQTMMWMAMVKAADDGKTEEAARRRIAAGGEQSNNCYIATRTCLLHWKVRHRTNGCNTILTWTRERAQSCGGLTDYPLHKSKTPRNN